MKTWIAKRIAQKSQPDLVLVAGTGGKSMLASMMQELLSDLGRNSKIVEKNSLTEIIHASASESKLGVLKQAISSNMPDLIISELHEVFQADKELLQSFKNHYLFIPWVATYEVEEYGSLQKYLLKKVGLTKQVAKHFTILYNNDIPGLKEALETTNPEKLISVSARTENADFKGFNLEPYQAEDAHISNDYRVKGIQFKVKNGGATLPIKLPKTIGEQSMYSVLLSMQAIKLFGLNQVDALPKLREYAPLPGRLKLVPGIKRSLLIDDSYSINVESALQVFGFAARIELPEEKRKIAVVSDLLVHGASSEQAHCLLGAELAEMNYDAIVAIGERSHDTLRCANEAGMDESKLFHFMDVAEAGKFIQHELQQGDLVVVKGDKEFKFEGIIKELMAFPLKAKEEILQR